jgi:hypothetical protein
MPPNKDELTFRPQVRPMHWSADPISLSSFLMSYVWCPVQGSDIGFIGFSPPALAQASFL